MFKVAITDFTFPSLEIEQAILQPVRCEILSGQCKTPEELVPLVADADAVITQFAPVNADVIAAMRKARVIMRYGIGVDNVDLDAAQARSIPVCNVPDYCIEEVADHTLAFILATTRQVVQNNQHIRDGKWGLATPLDRMFALRNKVVGIIGFGRIGREVASRLAPFKCRRVIYDPHIPPRTINATGCKAAALSGLLMASQIVTLHCPSTPQTRKMINADSIGQMRRGTILINLARGDLIDTPALVAALNSGHIAAAALDVCDPEPIPLDSPLRSLPNVIASSHVASASVDAARKLRETAAQIVVAALRGKPLCNIVNGVVSSH